LHLFSIQLISKNEKKALSQNITFICAKLRNRMKCKSRRAFLSCFTQSTRIILIFWDNAWLFRLYCNTICFFQTEDFSRIVQINFGEIFKTDWLKSCIYFPYSLSVKMKKKQEILWYEMVHNYIPFLLKTSKGTRNFIRSMTYMSQCYSTEKKTYTCSLCKFLKNNS
jgi:hypothetical protein